MHFLAYGVILKHLEVDKTTWGSFSLCFIKVGFPPLTSNFKRGTDGLFGVKEGRDTLFKLVWRTLVLDLCDIKN
jgi:hypothetical protein